MMAWLKERAQRAARQQLELFLRANHTSEQLVGTQGLFNYQCHRNCVQWLRDRPGELLEVVEGIYLDPSDPGEPVLHYVVRDCRSGLLHDVTLGWYAERLEFFATRTVPTRDLHGICHEFDRSLTYWVDAFVPRWQQSLLGIWRIT